MEVHPVTNITLKYKQNIGLIQVFMVRLIVFNATFNNISVASWLSVLLMEETGGPGQNHRPVASH